MRHCLTLVARLIVPSSLLFITFAARVNASSGTQSNVQAPASVKATEPASSSSEGANGGRIVDGEIRNADSSEAAHLPLPAGSQLTLRKAISIAQGITREPRKLQRSQVPPKSK